MFMYHKQRGTKHELVAVPGVEVIFVYPVQGDNKVWLWASTGCSGAAAASALPLGFFGCCHSVNDLVHSVFAGKCDSIVLITSSAVMVKE